MLAPDDVLQDRYRIVRHLGHGGMGAVYEAIDRRVSSIVAIKETFAMTNEGRAAFQREAKLLANLDHEAFPKVMDHFEERGGQYLVMQLIRGNDLEELLRLRESPFSPAKVLEWADQLLDALEELHKYKPPIIHRDIKPPNLKLTRRGKIILLDFGIAKGAAGQMSTLKTDGSLGAATPYFAPLEQCLKVDPSSIKTLSRINREVVEQIVQKGTDPRSDLYALGATLYNLMTCELPDDARMRAMAVWSGKPDPLQPVHEVNPQVSPAVSAVLMQSMALERSERPANAATMRRALREAIHQPVLSAPPTVSSPDIEKLARQRAIEQAQRQAEEETARLAEEERLRREEEERRKREEEEAARKLAAERDAARLAEEERARAEAEQARKRAEEDEQRRREEQERQRREEAEELRRQEESRRVEDERRKRAEAEERQRCEAEKAKRLAGEEAARKLAAEHEAARRRAEEERARAEEEVRRQTEEALRREEAVARLRAEEERRRREEEARIIREAEEAERRRAAAHAIQSSQAAYLADIPQTTPASPLPTSKLQESASSETPPAKTMEATPAINPMQSDQPAEVRSAPVLANENRQGELITKGAGLASAGSESLSLPMSELIAMWAGLALMIAIGLWAMAASDDSTVNVTQSNNSNVNQTSFEPNQTSTADNSNVNTTPAQPSQTGTTNNLNSNITLPEPGAASAINNSNVNPTTPEPSPTSAPDNSNTTLSGRKSLTPLRATDTAEGSLVMTASDAPLNNYSSYRSGDRFVVVILGANVPRLFNARLRGSGFEDVKVYQRGNDAVLSFRLQPGTTARVVQQSNLLEVLFTVSGSR